MTKPGHIEVMGEITFERPDAVFFHEGIKEEGAWLPRAEIEVFRNDPMPGIDTVWMPLATAKEHGFTHEEISI